METYTIKLTDINISAAFDGISADDWGRITWPNAVGKTGFLIGINANGRHCWELSAVCPATNLSGESRPVGWLGCTNGVDKHAVGMCTIIEFTGEYIVLQNSEAV